MTYDSLGCGCCKGPEEFPAIIANRPSLSAVDYRIGDYTSFRAQLLAAISTKPSLQSWRSRDSLDYGIAVLDLWAYLADIVTFYQERIANEAFLRTATLRESVLRLAALIDYRLGPGAAATAYLAFTLDKDRTLVLPERLRVQSVPGQNEKPQKFETVEEIAADTRYNEVPAYPLPVAFNPFQVGNASASIARAVAAAALSKPLARGERLLVFAPAALEKKDIFSVSLGEREIALAWQPPVQSPGLSAPDTRLVAYNRVFGAFGAGAPSSYMSVAADANAASGFTWTLTQRSDADFNLDCNATPPNVPEIPLSQRVDDLKPGTRLVVAARLPDGRLVTRLTTLVAADTRSATFAPLADTVTHIKLGVAAIGAPVAIGGPSNRQFAFVIADDGAAWIKALGGSGWRDWRSLGGQVRSLAVERGAGQLWSLFSVGTDGVVRSLSQSNIDTWGVWQTLGGEGTDIVAARAPNTGLITLVLRGPDGDTHVRQETGAGVWDVGWQSIGGVVSRLAAGFGPDNTLYVFGIGTDNAVWRNRRLSSGAWQGWVSLGGWVDLLAVARNQDGRLAVFGRGLDQALWRIEQVGTTWTAWSSLDGWIDQLAVATDANKIVVYARGANKALHMRTQTAVNGSAYSAWSQALSGPFDGLGIASLPAGGAVPFVRTLEGALRYRVANSSSGVALGYPIWPSVDRRTLSVYELTRDPLPLRQERFPDTISGYQVSVSVDALASIETGRRAILDDKEHDPQLVEVTAATVFEDSLVIAFTPALTRALDTETAVLHANVAKATHGETVSDEILGSGDASKRFLVFPVKKAPLTFVPQAGSPNGVASTLEVRVDGIRWREVPSLFGAASDDRVYTTAIADDGTMSVHFGGSPGARVPTGKNNVVATYRYGLGEQGNVRPRSLTTLLTRPAGLKSVINPGPAEGGAPAETLEQARVNAPSTVQTFGRIVSVRDFEDAARELAMVAKARAYVDWDGEEQAVFVVVAGTGGSSLATSLRDIAASLDALRDTNRKMNVVPHSQVAVELAVDVIADPAHTLDGVYAAVESALEGLFDFENRDLGQPVFVSDIYWVLHAQPGVIAADLDLLRPLGVAGVLDMADIAVPPTAIATLDPVHATIRVAYGDF